MGKLQITQRDIAGMCDHWLRTPVGRYLGSDYGADLQSILQNPMSAGIADAQIAKCRVDVPIISALPEGSVNVYSYDADIDKKMIVFEIAGQLLEVDGDQLAPQAEITVLATNPDLLDTINESAADALHTEINVTLPYPGYW